LPYYRLPLRRTDYNALKMARVVVRTHEQTKEVECKEPNRGEAAVVDLPERPDDEKHLSSGEEDNGVRRRKIDEY
jgi:hypothetical protein